MAGFFSRRPRAVYVGWVGHRNLGDEVLFEAHKRLFSGVALTVYRPSRLRRPLCVATRRSPYDFGILGGGTLINQNHCWLSAVRDLQASGIPMVCLGTGVASPEFWSNCDLAMTRLGHSGNVLAAWADALASFSYVGVRGPRSLETLTASGVTDVQVVGDGALSLSSDDASRHPCWRPGLVGLSVGHVEANPMWGDPSRYMDEVVEFVRRLCDAGREVHLLPVWSLDVPSNEAVLRRVDRDRCILVDAMDTYAEYSAAVRRCEVFVGQKLHATVIACMNHIPSVMIEYRPKCRDFMASMDLEHYVIRTDEFRAQSAAAMIEELSSGAGCRGRGSEAGGSRIPREAGSRCPRFDRTARRTKNHALDHME